MIPIFWPHGKRFGKRVKEVRRDRNFGFAGKRVAQRVGNHAGDSLRRRGTRKQVINNRAQAVHVGPRALPHGAVVHVLLDRRVARLKDGGQGLRHATDNEPRGPQVKQHRRAVTAHQNVVGRHVAMDHVLRVQQCQRIKNRLDQAPDVHLVKLTVGLPQLAQGFAIVITHRHVGGGILLPHAVHLNHGRVRETRQQLRLAQKVFKPRGERLAIEL